MKVHGVCKEDAVEKKKGKKKKAIQICVRVYEPKAQSLLPNDNIASPIILNSYLFLDDGREQRGFPTTTHAALACSRMNSDASPSLWEGQSTSQARTTRLKASNRGAIIQVIYTQQAFEIERGLCNAINS